MKAFIGAKIIRAEGMVEGDYLIRYKGVKRTEIKHNRPGYHVVYPDDYHSWSPKEVFEEAYRPVSSGEEEIIMMANTNCPEMEVGDDGK